MNENEEIIKIINGLDEDKKKELVEKVSASKSADEFIEIVNSNGFNLTEEMGKKFFELMNNTDEQILKEDLEKLASGFHTYPGVTYTAMYCR